MSAPDLSNHPAARKLVAAAEAAGLKVLTGDDGMFIRVGIASADGNKILMAEWWATATIREFNYASVEDLTTRKSKRAASLAKAKAEIGL